MNFNFTNESWLALEQMRMVAAFLSGTLLSMAGSVVQGLTQNSLASPSTLGFNAYVVLFILLAHAVLIFFNFPLNLSLELFSFILFLFSTVGVLVAANILRCWKGRNRKYILVHNQFHNKMGFYILLGLCFNLLVGALFSLMHFLFMTLGLQFPSQLWFGNFRFVDPVAMQVFIPFALGVYFLTLRQMKSIRALSFGVDFAVGLGIPVGKIQYQGLFLSLLAEGVVGCFFGIFSFMGLIFPHFLRILPWFQRDLRKEIIYGAPLCGVIFMLTDFLCAKLLFWGAEIPVGMVTSFLGSFFLMVVMVKNFKNNGMEMGK